MCIGTATTWSRFVMLRIANTSVTKGAVKFFHKKEPLSFSTRGFAQKVDRRAIFEFLNINTFDDKEIERSYKKFVLNKPFVPDTNTSVIASTADSNSSLRNNVRHFLKNAEKTTSQGLTEESVMDVFEIATKNPPSYIPTLSPSPTISPSVPASSISPQVTPPSVLSLEVYRSSLHALGQKLDERVWALTGSFLLTGMSIGIIIPCMPLLVQQLNISHGNFGLVISAFGLAKLMGNIPAAYYVDKYGRKPAIIYGLSLCSIGIGGYSLLTLPFLDPLSAMIGCRMLTGLGVSAFTAGAFMMMADVGTALNRTRTMAPAMTGFQAGIALGPAIGGLAIEYIGIPLTYATCGGLFALISLLNQRLLSETLITRNSSDTIAPAPTTAGEKDKSSVAEKSGILNAFTTAFRAWRELLRDPLVVNVVALNSLYWVALAGVQMTVLPLYMVSAPFNFTAGQIGSTFAMMSACSVFSSQPVAYLADRVGKVPAIFAGSALVTSALVAMPFATDLPQLWAVVAVLSVGSVAVQSVPTAYITEVTAGQHRTHALSLLRTAGDVGLLVGASLAGMLVDYSSFHTTIQANATLMALAAGTFAFRNFVTLSQSDKNMSEGKKK